MRREVVALGTLLFIVLLVLPTIPFFAGAQTATTTATNATATTAVVTETVTKTVTAITAIAETETATITQRVTSIETATPTKLVTATLATAITGTIAATPAPAATKVVLLHNVVKVGAGSSTYVVFKLEAGDTVEITAQIRGPAGRLPSDIGIAIIRPDGSIELQKQKYSGEFTYTFTAEVSGIYKILLDNSYSTLTPKQVDITVAKVVTSKATTVTKPVTKTITVTSTKTVVTTAISIVTRTVADRLQLAIVGTAALVAGLLIGFTVKRRP